MPKIFIKPWFFCGLIFLFFSINPSYGNDQVNVREPASHLTDPAQVLGEENRNILEAAASLPTSEPSHGEICDVKHQVYVPQSLRACRVFKALKTSARVHDWSITTYMHAAKIHEDDEDTEQVFMDLIAKTKIVNWHDEVFEAITLTAAKEKKFAREALKYLIAKANHGDWPASAYSNVFFIDNQYAKDSFIYLIDHYKWMGKAFTVAAGIGAGLGALVGVASYAVNKRAEKKDQKSAEQSQAAQAHEKQRIRDLEGQITPLEKRKRGIQQQADKNYEELKQAIRDEVIADTQFVRAAEAAVQTADDATKSITREKVKAGGAQATRDAWERDRQKRLQTAQVQLDAAKAVKARAEARRDTRVQALKTEERRMTAEIDGILAKVPPAVAIDQAELRAQGAEQAFRKVYDEGQKISLHQGTVQLTLAPLKAERDQLITNVQRRELVPAPTPAQGTTVTRELSGLVTNVILGGSIEGLVEGYAKGAVVDTVRQATGIDNQYLTTQNIIVGGQGALSMFLARQGMLSRLAGIPIGAASAVASSAASEALLDAMGVNKIAPALEDYMLSKQWSEEAAAVAGTSSNLVLRYAAAHLAHRSLQVLMTQGGTVASLLQSPTLVGGSALVAGTVKMSLLYSMAYGAAAGAIVAGTANVALQGLKTNLGYKTQGDIAFVTAAMIKKQGQFAAFKVLIDGANYHDWSLMAYNSILEINSLGQSGRMIYLLQNAGAFNWQDPAYNAALKIKDAGEVYYGDLSFEISHQEKLFRTMVDRVRGIGGYGLTKDWPAMAYATLPKLQTKHQGRRFSRILKETGKLNWQDGVFFAAVGLQGDDDKDDNKVSEQEEIFMKMLEHGGHYDYPDYAYTTLAFLQNPQQVRRFKTLIEHRNSKGNFNWQKAVYDAVIQISDTQRNQNNQSFGEILFEDLINGAKFKDWPEFAYQVLGKIDSQKKFEAYKVLIASKKAKQKFVYMAVGDASSGLACDALIAMLKVEKDWKEVDFKTASKISTDSELDGFLKSHGLTDN